MSFATSSGVLLNCRAISMQRGLRGTASTGEQSSFSAKSATAAIYAEVFFRQVPQNRMLLFVRGMDGPVWAARAPYFDCPHSEFSGMYRDNPYFRPDNKGFFESLFGR